MVQSFTRFHRNVSIPLFVSLAHRFFYNVSGGTVFLNETLILFYFPQVISPAALFLAAKVEEQPRKLEHVIKVAHACLNPQDPSPDVRSDVSSWAVLKISICDLLWKPYNGVTSFYSKNI